MNDITDILNRTLNQLGTLPGIIGGLAQVVNRFTSAMTPVMTALGNVFSHTGGTGGGTGGGGGGGSTGPSAGLGQLAKIAGVAAVAIGAMVASVNIAQDAFQQLTNYVRLFNPGVIVIFQQALDNLGATIGRAFVPLFTDMTVVVRQFTAALAPVMQALVPIMQQFADTIGNILVASIQQFASVLNALIPSINAFLEVMGGISQVFLLVINIVADIIKIAAPLMRLFYELSGMGTMVRILTRVFEALNEVMKVFDAIIEIVSVTFNTLMDTVVALLGSIFPLQKIMDGLAQAVQFVVRNLYVFAVMMAKMAGMTGVVDALIASVEGRLKAGDTAAQSPQMKTIEQLSKDLALAAAAAGGAGGKNGVRNEQEFWQKTLEEMRAAKANGVSITQILQEIKAAILRMIPGGGAVAAAPPNGGSVGGGGLRREIGTIVGGAVGTVVGGFLGGVPGAIAGNEIGMDRGRRI